MCFRIFFRFSCRFFFVAARRQWEKNQNQINGIIKNQSVHFFSHFILIIISSPFVFVSLDFLFLFRILIVLYLFLFISHVFVCLSTTYQEEFNYSLTLALTPLHIYTKLPNKETTNETDLRFGIHGQREG